MMLFNLGLQVSNAHAWLNMDTWHSKDWIWLMIENMQMAEVINNMDKLYKY